MKRHHIFHIIKACLFLLKRLRSKMHINFVHKLERPPPVLFCKTHIQALLRLFTVQIAERSACNFDTFPGSKLFFDCDKFTLHQILRKRMSD